MYWEEYAKAKNLSKKSYIITECRKFENTVKIIKHDTIIDYLYDRTRNTTKKTARKIISIIKNFLLFVAKKEEDYKMYMLLTMLKPDNFTKRLREKKK